MSRILASLALTLVLAGGALVRGRILVWRLLPGERDAA